jgi:hypothetical protein
MPHLRWWRRIIQAIVVMPVLRPLPHRLECERELLEWRWEMRRGWAMREKKSHSRQNRHITPAGESLRDRELIP